MVTDVPPTVRQIDRIGRVVFAALLTTGAMAWSVPSLSSWAALAGGILATFLLWLIARTVEGCRKIPGNGWLLLPVIPAAVLTVHCLLGPFRTDDPYVLAGAMNVSAIFHLLLLLLGILLCQDMLAGTQHRQLVVSFCAGALMLGALLSGLARSEPILADALGLQAGLATTVWFWTWWPDRFRPAERLDRPWRRALAIAPGASWLAWQMVRPVDPLSLAILAVAIAAAAIGLGKARRVWLALAGWCALAAARSFWTAGGAFWPVLPGGLSALGRGEQALQGVWQGDSGWSLLLGGIGWIGTGAVVALALAVWIVSLGGAARRTADPTRALAILLGAVLGPLCLLAAGGTMIGSTSLGLMLAWGLVPAATRRPAHRRWPGLFLVGIFLAFLLLIGIVARQGLVVWIVVVLGGRDIFLHAVAGLLLTLLLFWYLGSRSLLWGAGALVLAVGAGGLGEAIQMLWTQRSTQWKDFWAHLTGSLIAVVPYLLCMGARLAEPNRRRRG